MKLVYIGSPLTPIGGKNHAVKYLDNVRKAITMANKVILKGHAAYCPAVDLLCFLTLKDGEVISYAMITKMSLEILKRCDALFLMDNWPASSGCRKEYYAAARANIPIFEWEEGLERWLMQE